MASVKVPLVDPSTGKVYADVAGTGTGSGGLDMAALAAAGFLRTNIETNGVLPSRPAYDAIMLHVVTTTGFIPTNDGNRTGGGGLAPLDFVWIPR